MAYKEYFDTRVDFNQPYEPIVKNQEYEILPKTNDINPVEYEQFKKYLEFQKEKEILMRYEREGLITIRRATIPEPVVVEKEPEVSDKTIGLLMLGGFIIFLKFAIWVL